MTVRHGDHSGLHRLRKMLEATPELIELGPAGGSARDHGTGRWTSTPRWPRGCRTTSTRSRRRCFAGLNRAAEGNRIYLLKREVVELRRAVIPLAEPLHQLATTEMECIPAAARTYFRDVEDHIAQVIERVSAFDELLTTLVAANLAQVSVKQNEDMRKISAWVAIIAVPTMVAGI